MKTVARRSEVGGLPLQRLLPAPGRRLVGAWCFLDHAGPAQFDAGTGMQVGAHTMVICWVLPVCRL